MAKKKKKRTGDATPNRCESQSGTSVAVPQKVLDALGQPVISLVLVDGSPADSSRILLSPETMHEARLQTGSMVGLSLSNAPLKMASKNPASAFAPGLNSSDMSGCRPLKISDLLSDQLDNSNGEGMVEEYMLLAEAWPGVKLEKGTAQLSGALLGNFGSPPSGSSILVYKTDSTNVPIAETISLGLVMQGGGTDGKGEPVVVCEGRKGVASNASEEKGQGLQARQVEWLTQALSNSGSKQIELLSEFAVRQLSGRTLMGGSLVPITVLGCSVVFRVGNFTGESLDESQGVRVRGDVTKIHLEMKNSGEVKGEHDGNGSVSSGDSYLRSIREAVQRKSQGSSQEAASEAAVRAAAAGVASIRKVESEPLGGLSEYDKPLQSLIVLPLKSPETFCKYGLKPPKGVIFHGPPGTGKTVLACEAARRCGARMFVINGPDIMSEFLGGSEAALSGVFSAAEAFGPSIVFIDEVDALMPARGSGAGGLASSSGAGMSNRLVTTLLTLMDGMKVSDGLSKSVIVIAATNRLDAIDAALRRPGRFDREIEVGVPSPQARLDILHARLSKINHGLSEVCIKETARNAHGFVTADLAALCREAGMNALRRIVSSDAKNTPVVVSENDLKRAQTVIRPSAMREIAVEVPNVRWDDVGGLADVKQQLKEAVEWPIKHASSLIRVGAKPPKGVLLYGPPGCSKTLLAKAVATETGMNFLSVKGSELLSTFVGESEKALLLLFSRARLLAPCIIFFDEIDGLAGNREGGLDGGTGVGQRMVTQLLTELDGVKDRGHVIVIAATNKPDALDSALLRPGRFDRLVYVPPPDVKGREAILRVCLRKMPTEIGLDLEGLAGNMDGYTGADIAAVCQEAGLVVLDEDLNGSVVASRHLSKALQVVPPSAPSSFYESAVFDLFQRRVKSNPED
ncbi:hypothetical protein BSKO_04775 [Bryopsis sp. KO-2023]|nr:hypothetical protein BSKO_04775 [Bryopsis sp. KO-2023]